MHEFEGRKIPGELGEIVDPLGTALLWCGTCRMTRPAAPSTKIN